ncbi:uncharacterized protein LOC119740412 [Patiria miniata]|uniref:C2H2-type domain-containing protein n=1 Tax=Patiria miniata TaxID=46514 RepID=A0A914B688_PATMI|nr:uncharacterized protein LOC119740412 [Patiria miniata]
MMNSEGDVQEESYNMNPVRMLKIKTEPKFEDEIESVWHNMATWLSMQQQMYGPKPLDSLQEDCQTTSATEVKQESENACPSDLDEDELHGDGDYLFVSPESSVLLPMPSQQEDGSSDDDQLAENQDVKPVELSAHAEEQERPRSNPSQHGDGSCDDKQLAENQDVRPVDINVHAEEISGAGMPDPNLLPTQEATPKQQTVAISVANPTTDLNPHPKLRKIYPKCGCVGCTQRMQVPKMKPGIKSKIVKRITCTIDVNASWVQCKDCQKNLLSDTLMPHMFICHDYTFLVPPRRFKPLDLRTNLCENVLAVKLTLKPTCFRQCPVCTTMIAGSDLVYHMLQNHWFLPICPHVNTCKSPFASLACLRHHMSEQHDINKYRYIALDSAFHCLPRGLLRGSSRISKPENSYRQHESPVVVQGLKLVYLNTHPQPILTTIAQEPPSVSTQESPMQQQKVTVPDGNSLASDQGGQQSLTSDLEPDRNTISESTIPNDKGPPPSSTKSPVAKVNKGCEKKDDADQTLASVTPDKGQPIQQQNTAATIQQQNTAATMQQQNAAATMQQWKVTFPDGNSLASNQSGQEPLTTDLKPAKNIMSTINHNGNETGPRSSCKESPVAKAKKGSKKKGNAVQTLARVTPGKDQANWMNCPDCDMNLTDRSLMGHLYVSHDYCLVIPPGESNKPDLGMDQSAWAVKLTNNGKSTRQCRICKNRIDEDSLINHLLHNHHAQLKCPYVHTCKCTTATLSGLKRHIRKCHDDIHKYKAPDNACNFELPPVSSTGSEDTRNKTSESQGENRITTDKCISTPKEMEEDNYTSVDGGAQKRNTNQDHCSPKRKRSRSTKRRKSGSSKKLKKYQTDKESVPEERASDQPSNGGADSNDLPRETCDETLENNTNLEGQLIKEDQKHDGIKSTRNATQQESPSSSGETKASENTEKGNGTAPKCAIPVFEHQTSCKCSYCDLPFTSQEQLLEHMFAIHDCFFIDRQCDGKDKTVAIPLLPEFPEPCISLTCRDCPHILSTRSELIFHMTTVHGYQFVCPMESCCHQQFHCDSGYLLLYHLRSVHNFTVKSNIEVLFKLRDPTQLFQLIQPTQLFQVIEPTQLFQINPNSLP